MKNFLFVCAIALCFVSCVSKSKYESMESNAEYWENRYNELNDSYGMLNRKYNDLVNQYNGLVDEYNELRNFNYDNMNNSEEYQRIIMRAKDAVDDLKKHFNSFREGYWYDADDIERDIREVESKLDGWL